MRTQSILAGLLVTVLTIAPFGAVKTAAAQTTPPPGETPPNYTPPPPPSGTGTGTQENYAEPTAPPPGYGAPPRPSATGGADVQFAPNEPDLQLYSMSGEAPFEAVHYHRGWWGGHYSVGYGWAPQYSPVCDQACRTRFVPGAYRLALSKNGGRVVPVWSPTMINGPSLLNASYTDRGGLRAAGWVIGIAGAVGGIVMIAASLHEHDECDPDGFCQEHDTADGGLLFGGIGVLVASGIVGSILIAQHDEAHITVEPLRLSSYGSMRESIAAMGGEARPQGAALALHF
ncbi:MAG TPA: hypothetical protein VHV51_18840 [Polyangiaceae bacterium]|jgi:hypothetical protein|nr:hypothetical protein [Polyangiaceae bacterium]